MSASHGIGVTCSCGLCLVVLISKAEVEMGYRSMEQLLNSLDPNRADHLQTFFSSHDRQDEAGVMHEPNVGLVLIGRDPKEPVPLPPKAPVPPGKEVPS